MCFVKVVGTNVEGEYFQCYLSSFECLGSTSITNAFFTTMARITNHRPLSNLNRNSKVKWRRRWNPPPALRFVVSGFLFFLLGFLIASIIHRRSHSAHDEDRYENYGFGSRSITSLMNMPNKPFSNRLNNAGFATRNFEDNSRHKKIVYLKGTTGQKVGMRTNDMDVDKSPATETKRYEKTNSESRAQSSVKMDKTKVNHLTLQDGLTNHSTYINRIANYKENEVLEVNNRAGPGPELFEQMDSTGVDNNTSVRDDFMRVILHFMDTAPILSFDAARIRDHFELDENNMKRTAMLVTIKNGVANFTHDFDESRHGRCASVKYIVRKILADRAARGEKTLPDVTFLVMVSDGHGAHVATFGSARHWRHWDKLIPVPMGNRRGLFLGWGTQLHGWDNYIKAFITETHGNYTWASKTNVGFFRGTLGMQTHSLGSCNWQNNGQCERADNWTQINRGVLYLRTRESPDLFDVGFTSVKQKDNSPPGALEGAPKCVGSFKFVDFQRFKYLVNVGSNQDWAERLRVLLFTNSAIIKHEAETQEFFTPLLRPWIHYIPTNLMMTDLVSNVKWATQHDDEVKSIVERQNAFAHRYINENAMQMYWELSIDEFAKRQHQVQY